MAHLKDGRAPSMLKDDLCFHRVAPLGGRHGDRAERQARRPRQAATRSGRTADEALRVQALQKQKENRLAASAWHRAKRLARDG